MKISKTVHNRFFLWSILLIGCCVFPALSEEPQGVPPIKVVYFTPSDRTSPPDRQERLGRVMKHIQDFYRKGMEANGHGLKTFALEWETPEKLRLYDVQGQRPFENYPKGSEGIVHEEVRNALKQKGINIDDEYVLILGAWVEWKGVIAREIGPYSGIGNLYSGVAFACDDKLIDADLLASKEPGGYHYMIGPCSLGMYNTLYVGGIAHELGHAFGLPHESEQDSQRETLGISIMSKGNHYYGKALRNEGPDTFLPAVSTLTLSAGRAFNSDFKRAAGRWSIEQLDAAFQDKKLIVNLKIRSDLPQLHIAAYNDNLLTPGDYDATGWIAASENPVENLHEFRLEIDELELVPYEMRLRFIVPGGIGDIAPIRYSNITGTPTVQAFSDTMARMKINDFLDKKEWDSVSEVIEKQIERFPKSRTWVQKLKHLKTVKNPPDFFKPDTVSEEIKTIDLTYAKALEERVGWYEPSRGILRQFGFIEVDGTFFTSGIYAHANSLYKFSIGKQWKDFRFMYGVQDENPGEIIFIVRGDGKEIFRSETVRPGKVHFKQIDISDVEILELITEYAGSNTRFGRGLWLDPQLTR